MRDDSLSIHRLISLGTWASARMLGLVWSGLTSCALFSGGCASTMHAGPSRGPVGGDSHLATAIPAPPSASATSSIAGAQALDPTERLLVERGLAESPMELVTNETASGQRFLGLTARPLDPHADPVVALLERMRATLLASGGVGIAAPQVGVSRSVVLVQRFEAVGDKRTECALATCPLTALFNPRIVEQSTERELGYEGCLSVPAGYGQVRRATWLVVAYQDETGAARRVRFKDFTARIVQHELDHLVGRLFVSYPESQPLMTRDAYRALRDRTRQGPAEPQ